MNGAKDENAFRERPDFLKFLAILGYLGCLCLVIGTLIAQVLVPGHDWMADTISDLAAGRMEIVMDVALYGFAGGCAATALAASHAHLGKTGWSAGVMSLSILSALVTIVGARNEYGDGDSDGVVIHIYLVYGLGLFFAVVAFSMASGVARYGGRTRWGLIALGVLWVLSAPVFFFLPTGIDGLYERYLGLVACAILVLLNTVFLRCSKAWKSLS